MVGFPLAGDHPSAERMVQALARGELDAAFIWGPQAGYFVQRTPVPLRLHMLPSPSDAQVQRFTFAIAMGVRRGDTALRDRLNELLARRQAELENILATYGVPLLPAQGKP